MSQFQNPFNTQFTQFSKTPEPFSQRLRKFLKTQPILALLMAQAIGAYILMPSTFFYGLTFVLMLYFGGVFLRQYFSDFVLVSVYLAGGAAGFFAYSLMFNVPLTDGGVLQRAAVQGSAIFALLAFVGVAKPDLRLRIFLLMQVRYWHVAAVLMIFLLLRRDIEGGGTHLAYLSGTLVAALAALIFVKKFWLLPFRFIREKLQRKRQSQFAHYETIKDTGRPLRDEEYNDIRAERQKKIDQILDKISRSGYESLTKAEKDLLFRQSQ